MTIGEAVESQKLRSWIVLAHLGTSSDYLDLFDFSLIFFGRFGIASAQIASFLIFLETGHKRSSLYNWQGGENPTLSWALLWPGQMVNNETLGYFIVRRESSTWFMSVFEFKAQAGPQCLEVHAEPFSFATLRTWHSKNSSIEIPEPMDSFAIFFAMPARTYLFLTSIGIKADHCRFRLGARLSKVSQFHPKSGRINPNYSFLAGHFEKHLAILAEPFQLKTSMASQDPGYFIFRDLMLQISGHLKSMVL